MQIRLSKKRRGAVLGQDAMSRDAFFSGGMDLKTEPSSAASQNAPSRVMESTAMPKEDPALSRCDPELAEPSYDFFCEVDGERYAGRHLLIDLIGARGLDDPAQIEATLRACVAAAGATLLHIHLHHFTPSGGVSGVALLAESHISIHSWPEHGYAALDVFMCGNTDPNATIDVMKAAFAPEQIVVKTELRGKELPQWNAGSKRPSMTASESV